MTHRRKFILGAIALGLTGRALAAVPAGLVEALRGGGHVVYFRHGATNWKGNDSQTWPREKQRLLSEKGIAQSRHIGARFKALGIPVEAVVTSPFYRCKEMGEIAFGTVQIEPRLVSPTNPAGAGALPYLKAALSTPRPGRGNLVLISHTQNIKMAAGVSLGEGEAAIFAPQGGGAYSVLGQVKAEEW